MIFITKQLISNTFVTLRLGECFRGYTECRQCREFGVSLRHYRSLTAHNQTSGLYKFFPALELNREQGVWQRPLIVLVGTDAEVQGIGGERERGRDTHKKRLLVVKNKSSI